MKDQVGAGTAVDFKKKVGETRRQKQVKELFECQEMKQPGPNTRLSDPLVSSSAGVRLDKIFRVALVLSTLCSPDSVLVIRADTLRLPYTLTEGLTWAPDA